MSMDAGQGVCPVCNKFQTTNANELQRHASACGDKSRLRRLSRFASGTATPAAQGNIGSSIQDGGQPANVMLAKSCDCCAIVGQVCWFCLKPEPHLSRSLLEAYGDLPIWYHPACIGGLAELTDSSLLAMYRAQAAGRSAAAVHTSSVGLSAMRFLSDAWLHEERQQKTLLSSSTTRPDDDKQRAGEEDLADDSEDDATPLLHLVKKPRVSDQLAARRTPFLNQAIEPSSLDVFASPTLAETPLPACTDSTDCKPLRSFQPPTSVRPSPFANKAVMQKAPSGSQQYQATQLFGNRPGFSWELSGYVTAVPPVRSDEKRVLSHHMSPRVTEMYNKAQDGATLNIKVLQFYEECAPGEWDRGFRNLVKTNVKQYLQKNITRRNVSWLLPNLPEDPDCSELLEVRPVQEGDFREELRPGIDVTVHAKAGIPAGAVLGLYRNITVTKAEERIIQDNPPEIFEGTIHEWGQKLDAYTADIEQPKPSYKQSRRYFGDIYEESLKNKPLACLAYMTGNILSCINDGCARPYQEEEDPSTEDQPQDRPANVALVAVAVGNWPFMFVVAKNDIAAGKELFLSYGDGFWTFQNDAFRAIKRDKQREMELEQKFRGSGTFTPDSQGGSQLHKACSGPPIVETAMSANHACSGPMPYKPTKHAATAPIANTQEVEKAAHQELGVIMGENDRQEAAADNQQELQQHESKDDIGGSQQPQAWEDAAAVDGPALAAHVMPANEDDIAPIIKKAKTEPANSPSRSRLARAKELSSAFIVLPHTAASKNKKQTTGGAAQQADSNTSNLLQPSSLRLVSEQLDIDMEVAIMQGSSISQRLNDFNSENDQRRCWALPERTDLVSLSACIQEASYSVLATSQHTDIDSSFAKGAMFAPDRKQLHACLATLGLGLRNSSKPVGAKRQGSAEHQPRHVPNAVDQTHQLVQSPPSAAQQDQPSQARPLQSGAEQGTSSEQQRRICRIGSTTGSTQLAPSLAGEVGREAEVLHRDPPLSNDRDESKPCDLTPSTYPGQRPLGGALGKLKSVNSRSKPFLSTPAANAHGQGKTAAASAKAGQHVSGGKPAKKRLRGQSFEHPAHTAGPSRLGSSKSKQPAAKQSTVPAVSAQTDSKTDTRPSDSGPASGIVSTQNNSAASRGEVAEQKATARHAVPIVKAGKPGCITTKHSASFGLRKSTDGTGQKRRIDYIISSQCKM